MAYNRTDPLNRFPYEIWAKCIQLYACNQEEAALPLLAVSSAWQQTLLVTPEIWTTIYFNGGNDEECRAECFFHLSRPAPVDLVLDRCSAGMDIVIKYGDRIRSLNFRTNYAKAYYSSDILRFSYKLSFGTYPNLLQIHIEPPCYVDDLIPLSLIRACPAVISIKWAYLNQTTIPSDMVFIPGTRISETSPIVSAAFSIANRLSKVLKEQKPYDGIISELADGIARILPFAALALEEIVCDKAKLLDAALRNMCTLTAGAANFIYFYAKQQPRVGVLKSASKEDCVKFKAFQDDFFRLQQDFSRAVDAESMKNEEARLLQQLNPVEEAGFCEDRLCMEGTRTAILDDAIAWALDRETPPNGPKAENIYWLYAPAGFGKTRIANSLCDRLRRSGNLGGSFFCRRENPILHQSKWVLSTLVYKLAKKWRPYAKLVVQALQDNPLFNLHPYGGETLLKLLQLVPKPPPTNIVLVIDALDECGDPATRRPLLKSLSEACSLVPWLKIIVTSRPEHDIKTVFEQIHVSSRDLGGGDQIYEDIQLFTRQRMALIASKCHRSADWPGEERLRQIIDRSCGRLVFVETVYQYLDGHSYHSPTALLAEILDWRPGEPMPGSMNSIP